MIETIIGPGNPKPVIRYLLRNHVLLAIAVALFVGAGALPYVLAPGPVSDVVSPVPFYAAVPIAIGAVLGVASILSALLVLLNPNPRRRGGLVGPAVAIAVALLVLAVYLLLSSGWLPGWYDGTSGTRSVGITGCGGYPPSIYSSTFPDGFPPDSNVNIHWASDNGTIVDFSFEEDTPHALDYLPSFSFQATDSSGSFSFTSSGGEWAFRAINESTCIVKESVTLTWGYTLSIHL